MGVRKTTSYTKYDILVQKRIYGVQH
jgi:hypothetical protein